MNEILVHGDIEKALVKLKKKFMQEFSKSIASHTFFETRTQRKRRKKKKSIQRLKKLEARSNTRVTEATRRARDQRKNGMDYGRLKSVEVQ
jgi:ribosomal protein S21